MVNEEQAQFEVAPLGERLRRAREAKGMSLDDVAGRTRIPIRHLQHIEIEEWDALPAATYAVGFARNYADAVGLDGAAIAAELRERIGGPRRRAPAPDYYEPTDPARVPPRAMIIAVVVMIAVLAGAYLLWRNALLDESASIPVLEVPPEAAPARPSAAQPAAPQIAAGGAVTLTATGEVWLRVSEGESGATLFMGSLNAGQGFTVPAGARSPVIRTGRPQLLRASVGGADLGPLEPAERTIDNVSLRPEDLAARAQNRPPPAAPLAPPPAAPIPQ